MLWVSQPWRPWISVFLNVRNRPWFFPSRTWLRLCLGFCLKTASKRSWGHKFIALGFSTDSPNMNIFGKRIQDVFGVKYQAMILLIYRCASSFTACDCHHTGLAKSFWSLVVQVVLAAVQQNGLALEKVRWKHFFCVDMLTDFSWFCHDWKMDAPSLNRHQMPFEMTRRCVNLGTEGNLLDLTEEVGNERGASTCIFYPRFVAKWGAFLNFFVRFLKDLLWRPLMLEISWFLPWKNHFRRNLTGPFPVEGVTMCRYQVVLAAVKRSPLSLEFASQDCPTAPGFLSLPRETKTFQNSWNLRRCKMNAWNWGVLFLVKFPQHPATSVTFWPFSWAFQVVTNTDNTFPFMLSHPSTTILPREKRHGPAHLDIPRWPGGRCLFERWPCLTVCFRGTWGVSQLVAGCVLSREGNDLFGSSQWQWPFFFF